MRYRKVLSRRTFLRGAGTVAIALPFVDEMLERSVYAAPAAPPARLVTMFFGLGLSKKQQDEGFSGPLEPYKPFANKMALLTNVDMQQARGGTVHFEGSPVIFVGEKKPGQNEARAGGASIDQLLKQHLHPGGAPTAIGTLAAGMWFREGCPCQPLRTWNADGSVAEKPIKKPSDLFDKVFGNYKPPGSTAPPVDPSAAREQRIRRSIIDSVIEQYKHFTSDNSPLGKTSKVKLDKHLTTIRECEKCIPAVDGIVDKGNQQSGAAQCSLPGKPSDPNLGVAYGTKGSTGGGAPKMSYQDFQRAFRLLADIYALALRCDIARFGNLLFESAGGHVQFTGTYKALGDSFTFPGNDSEHDGWFHKYDEQKVRLTQHFFQSNLAYFLSKLDDPTQLEANGKTVLDNTLCVIGTEVGKNHDLNPIFHGVVGGHGHFKPGIYGQAVNVVDVYNTILQPYGLNAKIGSKTGVSGSGEISSLLA